MNTAASLPVRPSKIQALQPPPLKPGTLWPAALDSWWVGLFVFSLPCLILAVFNAWDFDLLRTEMTPGQRMLGAVTVGWPAAAGLISACLLGLAAHRGWELGLKAAGAAWGIGGAYLIFVFVLQQGFVPPGVPFWMFNPAEFVQRQLMFGMIPVLFGLGRLALHQAEGTWVRSLVETLAAVAILAAILIPFIVVSSGFFPGLVPVGLLLFTASSLCIALILRVGMRMYAAVRISSAVGISALLAVTGLGLPLGGLLLNRAIPFPHDFQTWPVWLFAVVNGVFLTLPSFRNPVLHRVVWLGQCACLSFTLYFFLIFLPVLPLAPLAMIVFGAGLLMLVPTVLLALQLWRITDGWKEGRGRSRGIGLALGGVAAFLAIPASLMLEAHYDKVMLDRAVNYFHSPHYALAARFEGDPGRAAKLLEKIHYLRQGVALPLIDDYYRRVVFGGLVLPQAMMENLHQQLTGQPLSKPRPSMNPWHQPGRRAWGDLTTGTLPPNPEMLQGSSWRSTVLDDKTAKSTLTLSFQNPLGENAEFSADVHVAEGGYVTGYRLQMNGQWVEGRLADEKTATWLYERIRRDFAPRDPGLLRWVSDDWLKLRVFPVAAHEARTTEIDFVHARSLGKPAHVVLKDKKHESFEKGATVQSWIATTPRGALATVRSADVAPSPARQAVPLLILDYSAPQVNQASSASSWKEGIKRFHQPGAEYAGVFAANFEVGRFDGDGVDLPFRGSYDPSRAILTALEDFRTNFDSAKFYPVVFLCGGDTDTRHSQLSGPALAALRDLAPEDAAIRRWPQPSQNASTGRKTDQTKAIVIARLGSSVQAAPVLESGDLLFRFPEEKNSGLQAIEILQSEDGWQPLNLAKMEDPSFLRAVEAEFLARDRARHPHLYAGAMGGWLKEAKALGSLIPGLAFMAAETEAQWKTLERKEAEKAKKSDAFEVEEMPNADAVPEPGVVVLVLSGLALLAGRAWLQKRRRTS